MLSWLLKILTGERGRPDTRRRPAFKKEYGLDYRQPISVFEDKLVEAMWREGREVFVTAFCTDSEVLAVTASRGTKGSCRPSDEILMWPQKCRRLGATRIRQYHNHPAGRRSAIFSPADHDSHRLFKEILEPEGITLESILVYRRWPWGYGMKTLNRWERLITWLSS